MPPSPIGIALEPAIDVAIPPVPELPLLPPVPIGLLPVIGTMVVPPVPAGAPPEPVLIIAPGTCVLGCMIVEPSSGCVEHPSQLDSIAPAASSVALRTAVCVLRFEFIPDLLTNPRDSRRCPLWLRIVCHPP
jgi:hypothetical protein